MGWEIERKFRVVGEDWRTARAVPFRQGYLCADEHRSVRVRIEGARAVLTVKGAAEGIRRAEFEYEIPIDDARAMLDRLCGPALVEKHRHRVEFGDRVWEIDEFHGANEGLIIAEVELDSPDQEFEKPPWVGEEVTEDPRFLNANLARRPFREWGG